MKRQNQSFIYNFLAKKEFRVWRHILLIIVIAIIAVNAVFISFEEYFSILQYKIYWIILLSLVLDLMIIYFNLYFLVPNLLLKNKYLQYIIGLFILVSIYQYVSLGCQYYILKHENIPFEESSIFYSKSNLIKEFIFSFFIYTILIISVSVTVLFKSLLINAEHVNKLETEDLRSQLENMKEKVSPSFLSRILKKSSTLAIATPKEASSMLVKLSKILRYQLYDCNRDKVLLSSEIMFLANYLNLEKAYYRNFDFSIEKSEDLTHLFIPPLLFLPFIQRYIAQMLYHSNQLFIKLYFSVEDDKLKFCCINNQGYNINYSDVNHRLELLYNNQYSINIKEDKELTIIIKI